MLRIAHCRSTTNACPKETYICQKRLKTESCIYMINMNIYVHVYMYIYEKPCTAYCWCTTTVCQKEAYIHQKRLGKDSRIYVYINIHEYVYVCAYMCVYVTRRLTPLSAEVRHMHVKKRPAYTWRDPEKRSVNIYIQIYIYINICINIYLSVSRHLVLLSAEVRQMHVQKNPINIKREVYTYEKRRITPHTHEIKKRTQKKSWQKKKPIFIKTDG